MTTLALSAVLALGLAGGEGDVLGGLPRSLGQAEQPQPRPQEAAPAPAGGEHDVFEFGRVQAAAHLGFIAFSEDFESDPQFLGGIGARVDWVWMSRDVLGFDQDRVGLYADLSLSKIERDVDFLEDDSGTLIFFGFGADLNAYEDETFVVRGQAGFQYGHFGGADETDNGFAGVLGLDLDAKLAENVLFVFNPQVAFGNGGDQVYFFHFGVQYRF
jgi:hypothetical protein